MNINGIQYGRTEQAAKSISINIKENSLQPEDKDASQILGTAEISGLGATTSVQNQKQGVQSLMQEGADVIEQIKESAMTAQGSLDALFKKLSGADCVKLDEDGYGLNDMEPEEVVTVVERIKIMLATYCEDYQLTGSDIDIDKIKDVIGSTAMASKVAYKLSSYDVMANDENLQDAQTALDKAGQIGPLSDDAINYLVRNELKPSIDNIYNAAHKSSAMAVQEKLSDAEWEELKPQIEKLMKHAGVEADEKSLADTRKWIEQGIPVTEKNLQYKAALAALNFDKASDDDTENNRIDAIARALSDGKAAGEAELIDMPPAWRMVADAINTIMRADESNVVSVLSSDDELTIGALRDDISLSDGIIYDNRYTEYADDKESQYYEKTIQIENMTRRELTGYRQLEELRILMTAEAGLSLAKQGFNLDTAPIAQLVERLKQMELEWAGEPEAVLTVNEVQHALYDIADSPDDSVGAVIWEAQHNENAVITLGELAQTGTALRERYRRSGMTYEAVGTQVRTDLGDSVAKAVNASTDDILESLGLENTKANRDAVRILANNRMEMSDENISQVKEMYAAVRNLIDNMKPEVVLSMIRDNLNPMKTDVRELNKYLENHNTENGSKNEKFSRFLYKLEQNRDITEEERYKFIGIYRMMNIFKKDAGRAVGALLAQGSELTMSNLISVYSSRKAAGIDKRIDESAGMAELSGTVNYYNNLFDNTARKITPVTLKETDDEQNIEERSIENFCEAVQEKYDIQKEAEAYEKYIETIKRVKDADESIIRQLRKIDENASIDNISAMQHIMEGGFYSEFLHGLKLDAKSISDSMLSHMDSEEGLQEALKLLEDVSDEELDNALEAENDGSEAVTDTYETFENIRMRNKEIHLIAGMGARHDYHIPFEKDGAVGTIRLQVVDNKNDAGRIAIDFEDGDMGQVHIEARVNEAAVQVFAVTQHNEQLMSDRLKAACENIEHLSYNVSLSDQVPHTELMTGDDTISTHELYVVAKKLVVAALEIKTS